MWFRRKPKNRRLGRGYVLDVKLRSSQVRAARIRLAAVALTVVFAAVLGVYLVWQGGGWALNRLVYANPAFALQQIEAQTDGIIAPEQLRRWAGVKPGQNLMALDLARVQRDLEMISLIKSASVERVLPHTLRLRVTEREPIAQVSVSQPRPGGGVNMIPFYLDADGFAILPIEPGQRSASAPVSTEPLPLLHGLHGSEVQVGRRVDSPQAQAALQLLTAFDRSPMAGLVDLKSIDVSSTDSLLVSTGQGSEITFGLTDLDQQLRRWRAIFDQGRKLGKSILCLDLAVTNHIPARWLEASVVLPLNPKPHRLTRKKHV